MKMTLAMNAPQPAVQPDRTEEILSHLKERVLVLDGAMGTMIQRHSLTEADFRGERFAEHSKDLRGNNEILSLVRPDIISQIGLAVPLILLYEVSILAARWMAPKQQEQG